MGDPTRYALFSYLASSESGADVAELTKRFGVNHNAIRQHLAKLADCGLVSEETCEPVGRGRPRLRYRANPDAAQGRDTDAPYRQLSLMLLSLIAEGQSPEEAGYAEGRRCTDVAEDGADALGRLRLELAVQGFSPRIERGGDKASIVLTHCPYQEAVLQGGDVVCDLHRGLAKGMAEKLGCQIRVVGLRVRDPRSGSCRLELDLADRARTGRI